MCVSYLESPSGQSSVLRAAMTNVTSLITELPHPQAFLL